MSVAADPDTTFSLVDLSVYPQQQHEGAAAADAPSTPASAVRMRDLLTSSPRSPVCLLGSTPTMRGGALAEPQQQQAAAARSASASSSRSASAAATLPSLTSSPTSSSSSLPCSSDAPTDTEEESDGEADPAEPPIYFGTPSREEHARRRKVSARMRERRLLRKDSLDLARRRSIGPMDMPSSDADAPMSDAPSPSAELQRAEQVEEEASETGSLCGREESVGCRTIGQLDAGAAADSHEQSEVQPDAHDADAHESIHEAEQTSDAAPLAEQEPAPAAASPQEDAEEASLSFVQPSPTAAAPHAPLDADVSYKTESSYRTESESGDELEAEAEEEEAQEEEIATDLAAESGAEQSAIDEAASEAGSEQVQKADSTVDLDRTLRLSSAGQQDAPAATEADAAEPEANPLPEAAEALLLEPEAQRSDEDVVEALVVAADCSSAADAPEDEVPQLPQLAESEPAPEPSPVDAELSEALEPAQAEEAVNGSELAQAEEAVSEPKPPTGETELESEAPAAQEVAEPEVSTAPVEEQQAVPDQDAVPEAEEGPSAESPAQTSATDDEAGQASTVSISVAALAPEAPSADVFSSSPMRAAVHIAATSSPRAPSLPSTPMRISRPAALTPRSCALAAGSPASFDFASSPGVALAAHGARGGDVSLLNNLRAEGRHDSAGPESPFVLSRHVERHDFAEEGLELFSKRSGPAEGASPVRRRKSARLSMRHEEEEAKRQAQSPSKAAALVSPHKASPSKPKPTNVADALNAWADAKTMSPIKLQPVSPPAWSLSPHKASRALERSQGHSSPLKMREENAASPSRIPSPTKVLEIARNVPLPPSSPEAAEQATSSAPVNAQPSRAEVTSAPAPAKAGPSARLAESLRAARLASAQPAAQAAAPAPSAPGKAAATSAPSAALRPPTGVPAPGRRIAAAASSSVSGLRAPSAGPAASSRLPKPAAASGIARPVSGVPRKAVAAPKATASSTLRRAVAPAAAAARAVPAPAAAVRRAAVAKPAVERKAPLARPMLASRAASADQPPATPAGAAPSAAASGSRPAVASAPSSLTSAERPAPPAPSPAPAAPVAAEPVPAPAPPPVRSIRSAAVASRGPASAAPRRPTPENQVSALRVQPAAAAKLGALAASSSPERPTARSAAMRAPVIRDARLASSVPASRVWDSPSKLNRAMSSSTGALPSTKPVSSSSSPVRGASREGRQAPTQPPPPPESSVYGPQAAPGRARRVPAGSLAAIKTPPAVPAQPVQAPVPASSLPPLGASSSAATATSARAALSASAPPQPTSTATSGATAAGRSGRQPLSASQVQTAAAIVDADPSVSPMKAARRALQSAEAAPSSGGADEVEERGAKSLRPRRAAPATQAPALASQRLFPAAPPSSEAPAAAPSAPVPAPAPVKRSATRVPTASSVLNPNGTGDRAPEIPMSHAELVRLTNQHTRRNEVYLAKLDVVSIRIEGPRPPSPTAKVPKVTGARMDRAEAANARERRARKRGSDGDADDASCSSRGQSADPEQHMRGAGEVEDYHTPKRETTAARKKSVRWHKALFVGPSEAPADLIAEPGRSPARRTGAARGRSSLAAKTFPLDRNGNIAEADAPLSPRLRKVRVKIIKNIFDDDL